MKIGIIGGGISGLAASYYLDRRHDVTLIEAANRIGGHTHTHTVTAEGQSYAVDTGFIVFNESHYPLFSALLTDLDVASQSTEMSFSARDARIDMEYNATSLSGLFAQKRNLIRPAFWQMLGGIRRFYREARSILAGGMQPLPGDVGPSVLEFLQERGYPPSFYEWHLRPMAAALWSAPPHVVDDFPLRYMLEFFANHEMLQISDRKPWRVIKGGSARYVEAMLARSKATILEGSACRSIARDPADSGRITAKLDGGEISFDAVILACHSDQALALLEQPTALESEVLGALPYQRNDVWLHSDVSYMPRRRRAWAAWNALIDERTAHCQVTYSMNILQGVGGPDFFVTLNPAREINPESVYERMRYHHPVYTRESLRARTRRAELNGNLNTWYCGAYWGHGFHEDGVRSAYETVRDIEARIGA